MIVNSSLVTFYKNPDQDNEYRIDIRDLDNSGPDYFALKRFTYTSDVEADEGSLVVQENAILIAPHNKMLNRLDGVWYLNDFVSTTPVVRSSAKNDEANPPAFKPVDTTLSQGAVASASITCTVGPSATGIVVFKIGDDQYTATGITNGETPEFVMERIFLALPGGDVTPKEDDIHTYELTGSVSLDTIKITKKLPGVSTQTVTIVTNTTGATITPTNFAGGVDPINSDDGNVNPPVTLIPSLPQNQEYTYTARYVYRDGHKTKTAFPVYIKTTTFRKFNAIEIDTGEDIDDKLARIEIFRKTGSDSFFLIDSVKPIRTTSGIYVYYDDGKPNLTVLDEKEYIWTSSHKTHAVLRDRYIRANVEYADRDFDVSGIADVTASILNVDDPIVPSNSRVDVFARKRQEDGLLTFHKLIGGFTVDSIFGDLSLSVKHSEVTDAKEVGLFARYRGLEPAEFLTFNTPEIYNANIASIATYDDDAKDKPVNPHILLGWRYITAVTLVQDVTSVYDFRLYEENWDTVVSDSAFVNNYTQLGTVESVGFPATYTFNKFGVDIVYIKRYVDNKLNTAVYEMAIYDGLKEAISRNKVKIKLDSYPVNKGTLSSEVRDTELLDLVVDVVAVVDYSTGTIRLNGSDNNKSGPYSPPNSKVYLLLESDSVFNKINNSSLVDYVRYKKNIYPVSGSSRGPIVFDSEQSSYFKFTLFGVALLISDTRTETPGNTYKTFNNYYFLTDRSGDVVSNALIYLGKSTNTALTQSNLRTGYVKVISNNFITNELAESNVYETLVTADQLGTLQNDFPNQIIWSDPYIVGTDVSGNRTFSFSNFLSLQRDYGDIVRIEAIANRLLVFCERGVAVVMVGEVLTETVSGQTFVNAVNFLNSPTWILKNIKGIQPRSIKQFEGMLFFSDGQDVWMFGEGLTNISQGAITLAGSQVGAIDVLNQEYRISGGGKTYSYSIGSQQWSGPHTYVDTVSTTYGDRMISVIGGNIAEHNRGNDFAGAEYETIVESVANELDEASVDKIFRKFYIEHEDAETFEYGKDYSDMTSKTVAGAATKQGLTHIGVNPSNATARQIFWRIKSAVEGFKLKMISFNWTPRTRR